MILLALWMACVPEPDGAPPVDSEDTIGPIEPPEVETDVEPESDIIVEPSTCSEEMPDGTCPGTATCVAGRCLVPWGSTAPVPADAVAQWREIAEYTRTRWLLADTRGVDLEAWEEDGAAAVAAATTEGEAAWAMVVAMDRLRDGHTGLHAGALCAEGSLGQHASNVGACVVEGTDGLTVIRVHGDADWELGDVLLSIDGRSVEDLIADRAAQPRCRLHASSVAGDRAVVVRSLMMRPGGERVATVRRGDRVVQVRLEERGIGTCRTHFGVPDTRTLIGDATWAPLPDGATYLHIPQMGADDGHGYFGFEPLVEAAEEVLRGRDSTKALLVDLRGNPGGHTDVARTFADWMLPEGTPLWWCNARVGDAPDDLSGGIISRSRASVFVWSGPLAVLTDGSTYGSSEFLPRWVEETGRGLVVGSPTNGSFGMTWAMGIGGWGAYVNALRCERLDGTPLDGFPDPVDVPARQSAADAAAGIDSVVQAALTALAE